MRSRKGGTRAGAVHHGLVRRVRCKNSVRFPKWWGKFPGYCFWRVISIVKINTVFSADSHDYAICLDVYISCWTMLRLFCSWSRSAQPRMQSGYPETVRRTTNMCTNKLTSSVCSTETIRDLVELCYHCFLLASHLPRTEDEKTTLLSKLHLKAQAWCEAIPSGAIVFLVKFISPSTTP